MKPGTKLVVKGYDGKECGPFRWTEVREWIGLGYFTADDEVRIADQTDWMRIEGLPSLLKMSPSTARNDNFIHLRSLASDRWPVGPRAAAYLKILGCPVHPTRLNPYTANRWVGILQILRPHLRNEIESWASNQESHGRTPSASPDDATQKQIAYLRSIGHVIPDRMSKNEVQRLFSGPPTEGQMRRLTFYGTVLPAGASKDDASMAIDSYVKAHPESEAAYQNWKHSAAANQITPVQSAATRARPWWKRIFSG
jgi:hypothetical protein